MGKIYRNKAGHEIPLQYLRVIQNTINYDDWTETDILFISFMTELYIKDDDAKLEYFMKSDDFVRMVDGARYADINACCLDRLRRVFNIVNGAYVRISLKDLKKFSFVNGKAKIKQITYLFENPRTFGMWWYLNAKLCEPAITFNPGEIPDSEWHSECMPGPTKWRIKMSSFRDEKAYRSKDK